MTTSKQPFDLIVVGAGLFGLTVAERAASVCGSSVLVLERRPQLGGNAWSHVDPETGIEVHDYGTHVFHTDNSRVFEYISSFATFTDYTHRVWTIAQGVPFSLPINLHTLGQVYGRHFPPQGAREFLEGFARLFPTPASFQEKAISVVGPDLYRLFLEGYTYKQWGIPPDELPAGLMRRMPVRLSYDSRYFTDRHQGMPSDGYHAMLTRMAADDRIEVRTSVDFLEQEGYWRSWNVPIVYSGALDRLYGYRFGTLGWRTIDLRFRREQVPDVQGAAVINYADVDVAPTRTHEFRHLHPERQHSASSIVADEYSRRADDDDEPYYPVNGVHDRERLAKYRELATEDRQVIIGGRLGSYQYLDMHMAIASALTRFRSEVQPRLNATDGRPSLHGPL